MVVIEKQRRNSSSTSAKPGRPRATSSSSPASSGTRAERNRENPAGATCCYLRRRRLAPGAGLPPPLWGRRLPCSTLTSDDDHVPLIARRPRLDHERSALGQPPGGQPSARRDQLRPTDRPEALDLRVHLSLVPPGQAGCMNPAMWSRSSSVGSAMYSPLQANVPPIPDVPVLHAQQDAGSLATCVLLGGQRRAEPSFPRPCRAPAVCQVAGGVAAVGKVAGCYGMARWYGRPRSRRLSPSGDSNTPPGSGRGARMIHRSVRRLACNGRAR